MDKIQEEKEAASDSVKVSGQKSLPELLDEIARRAEAWETAKSRTTLIVAISNSSDDVPALVKALRRAVEIIDGLNEHGNYELELAQFLREPASVPDASDSSNTSSKP